MIHIFLKPEKLPLPGGILPVMYAGDEGPFFPPLGKNGFRLYGFLPVPRLINVLFIKGNILKIKYIL